MGVLSFTVGAALFCCAGHRTCNNLHTTTLQTCLGVILFTHWLLMSASTESANRRISLCVLNPGTQSIFPASLIFLCKLAQNSQGNVLVCGLDYHNVCRSVVLQYIHCVQCNSWENTASIFPVNCPNRVSYCHNDLNNKTPDDVISRVSNDHITSRASDDDVTAHSPCAEMPILTLSNHHPLMASAAPISHPCPCKQRACDRGIVQPCYQGKTEKDNI